MADLTPYPIRYFQLQSKKSFRTDTTKETPSFPDGTAAGYVLAVYGSLAWLLFEVAQC